MTDAEFKNLMEAIDEALKTQDVPIFARPLWATGEASRRLHMEIGGPVTHGAVPGRYDGLTMEAHINDWYVRRYGDRLNVDWSPGSVVVLIKGDAWRLKLPLILGAARITCDPKMPKRTSRMACSEELPVCNVLDCIEHFPRGLAATLSEQELQTIHEFFVASLKTLQELDRIGNKPYIEEALADLREVVAQILSRPPHYGLSRWSSLQFTEKLLKSYLRTKTVIVQRHHLLQQLADDAQKRGLPALDPVIIAGIQCSAGTRYGEQKVTLAEAISAHHASLVIAQQTATHIS